MEHKENPTKEDLIEYFSPRIAIRKLHEQECLRLMDVADEDIEKIVSFPFKSKAERDAHLENIKQLGEKEYKDELNSIKRQSLSKSSIYKMAGNSIVCSVLYYIFRNLFIEEHKAPTKPYQRSLFDL